MHEHTRVAHTEHTASAQDKQLCDMLGRSAYLNVFPFTLREQVIVIAFGITPPPNGPADARRYSVDRTPALRSSGAPARFLPPIDVAFITSCFPIYSEEASDCDCARNHSAAG